MTTAGLLDVGAATIVRQGTGEVIGYVYTVANGKGQLQRWLLYSTPDNAFEIKPPPAAMRGMSLADWQAEVANLWKKEATYVHAQADVYRHGDGTGGTWKKIPDADKLPPLPYPEVPGAPFQLDHTRYRALDVSQGQSKGLAYSIRGVLDENNAEYWMLPAGFQPAGGSAEVGIAPGSVPAATLQHFIEEANKSFGPGCRFAITACVNYKGIAAPGAP